MAAIITEKFRQHNADQFFESFSEASASTYYLFVGKATAFTSGTTGGSDSSPPTPADGKPAAEPLSRIVPIAETIDFSKKVTVHHNKH